MRTHILIKSVEERKQLLNLLFALGYKWHDEFTDADEVEREFSFHNYDIVTFNSEDGGIAGNNSRYNNLNHTYPTDIATIMNKAIVMKQNIVIDNIGDYQAIVTSNNIQVGCQTISFGKFQEIVDAVEKIKNN